MGTIEENRYDKALCLVLAFVLCAGALCHAQAQGPGTGFGSPHPVGDVHEAAARNDIPALMRILDARPSLVNKRDKYGRTPLIITALRGYGESSEFLLTRGADPDARDDKGRSPLHWAAGYGHADVAKLLVYRGAPVSTKDRSGTTPLHWAAGGGFLDVVQLLVENKAVVNARDNAGRTPMYYATQKGHKAVMELLRRNGGAY